MATLPTDASLTGATTTNAQQKTNFSALRTFLADLLGTDSSNKAAARAALGVPGTADFPASLASSGYVKIPTPSGNLILQWGSVSSANLATTVATFPIAFTTACYQVVASGYNGGGAVQAYVVVNDASLTQAQFNAFAGANNTGPSLATAGGVLIKYWAIGK